LSWFKPNIRVWRLGKVPRLAGMVPEREFRSKFRATRACKVPRAVDREPRSSWPDKSMAVTRPLLSHETPVQFEQGLERDHPEGELVKELCTVSRMLA
jgi:hypothetical protein